MLLTDIHFIEFVLHQARLSLWSCERCSLLYLYIVNPEGISTLFQHVVNESNSNLLSLERAQIKLRMLLFPSFKAYHSARFQARRVGYIK